MSSGTWSASRIVRTRGARCSCRTSRRTPIARGRGCAPRAARPSASRDAANLALPAMRALCHRGGATCGACCGLYNIRDLSRASVRVILERRTALLAGVPRTEAAFRDAVLRLAGEEAPALFPSVRVCPLLGYLDAEGTRVGCLAHPLAAGGQDLRDCGAYDVPTCDGFFCPSHSWLSEDEAELAVMACAGDPYLYGLVITDVPFLRAALEGVAALTGARVLRRHLDDPAFHRSFARLLALNDELAPPSDGLFGAFRPGREGEPLP